MGEANLTDPIDDKTGDALLAFRAVIATLTATEHPE